MKLIRILFVLIMCASGIMSAQTIAPKKRNTCGKPLTQCQYKGKHPSTTRTENKENGQNTSSAVSAPTGTHNGYGWVDLGLPSGTKWATMNVGASSPSDYGCYFAWGETSQKSSYYFEKLKYCLDATGEKFSKYVTYSEYGNVDGKTELDLSDDVAYVNWGSGWRMPSRAQQDELREKCKWTWTSVGGHKGYKVIGLNGNSIFLPAAGFWIGNYSNSVGFYGYYWSRSLNKNIGCNAFFLLFSQSVTDWNDRGRRYGQSVRAVRGSE